MASEETLDFNAAHSPKAPALEAFHVVSHTIKTEILKSRHHWDKHEPRMWSRVAGLSDHELTNFELVKDLVQVRSAPTSYGTVILGSIRIPAVQDEQGEGYVHVRIHDPPNRGTDDVIFHSIWTNEIREKPDEQPIGYQAVQTADTPLDFFNE